MSKKTTVEQTALFNEQIKTNMSPHNPPDHHRTNKDKINDQILVLGNALKSAAETHLEKRDIKTPDNTRSQESETLFKERQKLKNEHKYEDAKRTTYKIRKPIRKQKTDNNIKNLEDQLWHDIKKAKSTFVPTHTKLRRKDGTICESKERPHILADYFEND